MADRSPNPPTSKRLKVSTACGECRRRKVKCDDAQPVCKNCLKSFGSDAPSRCKRDRNVGSATTSSSTDHCPIGTLDARKSSSGRALGPPVSQEGSGGLVCTRSPPQHTYKAQLAIPVSVDNFSPLTSVSSRGASSWTDKNVYLQKEADAVFGEKEDDGPTAMLGALHPEKGTNSFFGGSSAGTFLRQIQTVVEAKISSTNSETSPDKTKTQNPPLQTGLLRGSGKGYVGTVDYVLPPRKFADSLFKVYWDFIYPISPFLDREQMNADYHNLWVGGSLAYSEASFLCLLNAIFALACQQSGEVQNRDRETFANTFYSRARSFVNMVRTPSIASVQVYLLMSQYLQSTSDHHECWMMTGVAARTAQSLGLHLPETSENSGSSQSRELMRRVWHGCVILDRMIAMTYGRPLMIHKSIAGSVPLPELEEDLPRSGDRDSQPKTTEQTPSPLAFFTQSLKLFRLLYEVLISFYSSHPQLTLRAGNVFDYLAGSYAKSSEIRGILHLDRDLSNWRKQLPPHLAQIPPPGSEGVLNRQAVVLQQRYLHVRMLSLRPILSAFVTSVAGGLDLFDEDTLSSQLAFHSSVICVNQAREAISIVYDYFDNAASTSTCLSEWWYNVMYVYTAATILIAACLSPSLYATTTEQAVEDSWQKALYVLKECSGLNKGIKRLLATLEVLYQQVPERYRKYDQSRSKAPVIYTPSQSVGSTANVAIQGQQHLANGPADPAFLKQPAFAGIEMLANALPQSDDNFNSFDAFDANFDPGDLSWLNDIPPWSAGLNSQLDNFGAMRM